MTRDEFVRLCLLMGYCSRKYAVEYCGDRQDLTDDDFVLLSQKHERQTYLDHQHDPPTTKRCYQSQDAHESGKSNRPWTHIYPSRLDLLREEVEE